MIGHNNWTGPAIRRASAGTSRSTCAMGSRILMDGAASGIIITATTISGFSGFDPNGIPEFVRPGKAMQYSESIDDCARIMAF